MGDLDTIRELQSARSREAATQLHQIASATTDKEVRKAARRALYLLAQSGITPAPAETAAPAPPHEPAATAIRAYASTYDGAGYRLLILAEPGADGGRPFQDLVLVSDTRGIASFKRNRVSAAALEADIQRYVGLGPDEPRFAAIEPDYARWLLDDALYWTKQSFNRAPVGYLEWRSALGETQGRYDLPPTFTAIAAAPEDAGMPRDPDALFAHPVFDGWFLDMAALEPWLARLLQIERGAVVTSDAVKAERRSKLIDEIVQALFTPDWRERFRERLQQNADILWRCGDTRAASMAAHQAETLQGSEPLGSGSFLHALVRRTLDAVMEQINETERQQATERATA